MHFGPYESCDFPARGPLTAIFPVIGPDGRRLAVQSLEGSPQWSAARRKQEAANFLARLTVQKQVAASPGVRHWAPVHDDGSTPGEPWYCTELYPTSCAQLVGENSVRLNAAALRNITRGVIAGLIELRDALGREHGKLTPGNVLLTDPALAQAQIRLCDPLSQRTLTAGSRFRNDQEALGNLIYQLVVKREPGSEIANSPEWDSLGPTGEGWRKFCARLMDSEGQFPRLEDALSAVPRPPRVLLRRFAGLVTCALIVLGIAAFAHWRLGAKPPATGGYEPWNQLCDDYGWFGTLLDRFGELPGPLQAELREKWNEDVDAVRHETNPVELLHAADESPDPSRWDHFKPNELKIPAGNSNISQPTYIKPLTDLIGGGLVRDARAREKVKTGEDILMRTAPAFADRIADLRRSAPDAPWAPLLSQKVEQYSNAKGMQQRSAAVEICCLGRVLSNFDPRSLSDNLKLIGLEGTPIAHLQELPELSQKASEAAILARKLPRQDPGFIAERDAAVSKATTATDKVIAWTTVARAHVPLDGDQVKKAIAERGDGIAFCHEALSSTGDLLDSDKPAIEQTAQRILKTLRSVNLEQNPTETNAQRLRASLAELDLLKASLAQARAKSPIAWDREHAILAINAATPAAATLRRFWDTNSRQIKERKKWPEYRAPLENLFSTLNTIGQSELVAGSPPSAATTSSPELLGFENRYANQKLTDFLAQPALHLEQANQPPDAFRVVLEDFNRWRDRATKAVQQASDFKRLLDDWRLPPIEDVRAWRKSIDAGAVEPQLVAETSERLDQLFPAAPAGISNESRGLRLLTEWERATGLSPSQEAAIEARLGQEIQSAPKARQQELADEVRKIATSRWISWADAPGRAVASLASDSPPSESARGKDLNGFVSEVFARLDQYVKPEVSARDPYLQFNRMLHSWRAKPPATDEQAKQLGKEFLEQVAPLEVDPAQKLRSAVAALSGGAQERSDVLPGWVKQPGPDFLEYKKDDQDLKFFRVVNAQGNASYVCSTAVSVSLFNAVVTADMKKAAGAWKADLDISAQFNSKLDVRLWDWDVTSNSIIPCRDDGWVIHRGSTTQALPLFDLNTQDLRPDNNNDRDVRAWQLPMTHIGPLVAERFAGLLNCRLATSAEWLAAWKDELAASGHHAKWNFADKSLASFADRLDGWLADPNRLPAERGFFPIQYFKYVPHSIRGNEKIPSAWVAPDDGYAFLAVVDPDDKDGFGAKFRHLIGNVWTLVKDGENNFYAIGGSAFTAASDPSCLARQPLDVQDKIGYCDLGIRLAMDPPPASPREQFLALLQDPTITYVDSPVRP